MPANPKTTTEHDSHVAIRRGRSRTRFLWAAGTASLLGVGALVGNVAGHHPTDAYTDHRPVITDDAPSAMLEPRAFDRAIADALAEPDAGERSALLDGRSFDAAIAAAIEAATDTCP